MKNLLIILGVMLFLSCGNNQEKKKGFEYNRTQQEEKNTSLESTSKIPVDMENKGIGPVTKVVFENEINTAMAQEGETAFNQKCTACHMADRKLIGPAMKGIYERRSPEWVMNMILNPTEMLKQDPIAKALLQEYNNILMLNQNLSQEEARAISEYLRTL